MEFNLFGREVYVKKGIIIAVSTIVVLGIGFLGYLLKGNGGQVIISGNTTTEASVSTAAISTRTSVDKAGEKDSSDGDKIKVYIVGCVRNSGVVTLKKGQIIDDAIKAAGGATKDADLNNINLAFQLNENTMLKILSKKETQIQQHNQIQIQKADKKSPGKAMSGVKIVKDSGGAVVSDGSDTNVPQEKGKININTASISELDTLPGVGEKTASDIIGYREKNGKFKKIEDIMNVPRIGESRFKQMKELITVQ